MTSINRNGLLRQMYCGAPLKAPAIAILVLTATTALIAQADRAHLGDPTIANGYVRVWKLNLPPRSSILVPDSGHIHILIGKVPIAWGTTSTTLTDSSDIAHYRTLDLRPPGVWLLESVQHQISNPNEVAFTGLLLDLQTDPGRLSCTEPKRCYWSIRPGDPVPLILSEHVTIFNIDAPWTTEPRSLIVPTSDVFIDGKKQPAWDPVWMPSPLEITGSPDNPARGFAGGSPFLEVSFYDRPFCFCKRVRNSKPPALGTF